MAIGTSTNELSSLILSLKISKIEEELILIINDNGHSKILEATTRLCLRQIYNSRASPFFSEIRSRG